MAELADPNRDRVLDALRELSDAESAPAAGARATDGSTAAPKGA